MCWNLEGSSLVVVEELRKLFFRTRDFIRTSAQILREVHGGHLCEAAKSGLVSPAIFTQ